MAIEPLEECWTTWPDDPQLIALPVAISLERGFMDFNVNNENATSTATLTRPHSFRNADPRSHDDSAEAAPICAHNDAADPAFWDTSPDGRLRRLGWILWSGVDVQARAWRVA